MGRKDDFKVSEALVLYGNIDFTFFHLPMGASLNESEGVSVVLKAKLSEQLLHAVKT